MWCWMIGINEDGIYVWICVCIGNLHVLDRVWHINDMIGDLKDIYQCITYTVYYLDGWRACDIVYACPVYFKACMEEGAVREPIGVKDGRWWIDRVIGRVIREVIGEAMDGG